MVKAQRAKPPLPYHKLLALAVESGTDPRTARKFLTGEQVQPRIADRIKKAMTDLGLEVAQ